jgi:hypothetical protein
LLAITHASAPFECLPQLTVSAIGFMTREFAGRFPEVMKRLVKEPDSAPMHSCGESQQQNSGV